MGELGNRTKAPQVATCAPSHSAAPTTPELPDWLGVVDHVFYLFPVHLLSPGWRKRNVGFAFQLLNAIPSPCMNVRISFGTAPSGGRDVKEPVKPQVHPGKSLSHGLVRWLRHFDVLGGFLINAPSFI